jgi:ABC-type multidrug transport system fused ATPase/permease subunit
MAVVMQEFPFEEPTENIAYGRPEASEEEIVEAARQPIMGFHPVIPGKI